MSFVIAALYKFFNLSDPKALSDKLVDLFTKTGILGTLILASEGINGTVCGTREAIDELIEFLKVNGIFQGCQYKEALCQTQVFKRAKIKLKKEIVTFGCAVDPTKRVGKYVEPEDWNALISNPETVIIDTRNKYEYKIGTFKGAINPDTDNFKQFPEFVKNHLNDKKNKPIAMFCTGGVRCEKSTAYLLDQGFEDVFHLNGGILKYLEKIDSKDSLWQGHCYVFDDRVSVGHALKKGDHTICLGCGIPLFPEELSDKNYEFGVSCASCIDNKTPQQKRSLREKNSHAKKADGVNKVLHL